MVEGCGLGTFGMPFSPSSVSGFADSGNGGMSKLSSTTGRPSVLISVTTKSSGLSAGQESARDVGWFSTEHQIWGS